MIGQDDAASALDAIARTRQRAFEMRGYAHGGDIVIGWGLVWLVCNLLGYFRPELVWALPIGIVLGVAWSMWRGWGQGRSDVRVGLSAFAMFAMIALVVSIAGIQSNDQGNAMISAFVAGFYVLQGIWAGRRFAWIGLVIAACVIAGWFFDRDHLELWMGLGGGGALILSGIWLRRA